MKLTDDEIAKLCDDHAKEGLVAFAHAVEAKIADKELRAQAERTVADFQWFANGGLSGQRWRESEAKRQLAGEEEAFERQQDLEP